MLFLSRKKFNKIIDEKKAHEEFAKVRPEMEKGDLKAMIIAAIIVFLPVIILIVGGMFLFAWLLG